MGVIENKLIALREDLRILKSKQGVSYQEFLADPILQRAIERLLQTSIERCLDMGRHLIAEHSWREAGTNRDVFKILSEYGVLPANQLSIFLEMAGFRNFLVHEYDTIDQAVVFGLLKNHLADLEAFGRFVVGFTEAENLPENVTAEEET